VSDDAPEQSSKTEDPSQKRIEDARQRGDVVKSQEVNNWFMIAGSALLFALMAVPMVSGLGENLKVLMANADGFHIGGPALGFFFMKLAGSILMAALLPSIILAGFAVAGNLVQHRPCCRLSRSSRSSGRFRRLRAASACSRATRLSILPRGCSRSRW